MLKLYNLLYLKQIRLPDSRAGAFFAASSRGRRHCFTRALVIAKTIALKRTAENLFTKVCASRAAVSRVRCPCHGVVCCPPSELKRFTGIRGSQCGSRPTAWSRPLASCPMCPRQMVCSLVELMCCWLGSCLLARMMRSAHVACSAQCYEFNRVSCEPQPGP